MLSCHWMVTVHVKGRSPKNPKDMKNTNIHWVFCAMKRVVDSMCVLLIVSFVVLPSSAVAVDKKGEEKTGIATEDAELPKVPASLQDKEFLIPAKLNTKAKVYFIYKSRSTCGICVAEAPEIVKIYRSMHGKDAELVMLNIDSSKEAAIKWAKNSKMKFPIVAPGDARGIPFPYKGEGILPCMVAVDADGNKLGEANAGGVPAFLKDWRKMVRKLDKEEKAQAREEVKRNGKEDSDSTGAEEES